MGDDADGAAFDELVPSRASSDRLVNQAASEAEPDAALEREACIETAEGEEEGGGGEGGGATQQSKLKWKAQRDKDWAERVAAFANLMQAKEDVPTKKRRKTPTTVPPSPHSEQDPATERLKDELLKLSSEIRGLKKREIHQSQQLEDQSQQLELFNKWRKEISSTKTNNGGDSPFDFASRFEQVKKRGTQEMERKKKNKLAMARTRLNQKLRESPQEQETRREKETRRKNKSRNTQRAKEQLQ